MTVDYAAYQAAIDRALTAAGDGGIGVGVRTVLEVRCDRCDRKGAEVLSVPGLSSALWVASMPDDEVGAMLVAAAGVQGRVFDPGGRRMRGVNRLCRVLLDGAVTDDDRLRCLAWCPKHGVAEVAHAVARQWARAAVASTIGKVDVRPVRCTRVGGTT